MTTVEFKFYVRMHVPTIGKVINYTSRTMSLSSAISSLTPETIKKLKV